MKGSEFVFDTTALRCHSPLSNFFLVFSTFSLPFTSFFPSLHHVLLCFRYFCTSLQSFRCFPSEFSSLPFTIFLFLFTIILLPFRYFFSFLQHFFSLFQLFTFLRHFHTFLLDIKIKKKTNLK